MTNRLVGEVEAVCASWEGDEVRVESVAERLGVTARHLRRAFTESAGIGPKELARSVRYQRVADPHLGRATGRRVAPGVEHARERDRRGRVGDGHARGERVELGAERSRQRGRRCGRALQA